MVTFGNSKAMLQMLSWLKRLDGLQMNLHFHHTIKEGVYKNSQLKNMKGIMQNLDQSITALQLPNVRYVSDSIVAVCRPCAVRLLHVDMWGLISNGSSSGYVPQGGSKSTPGADALSVVPECRRDWYEDCGHQCKQGSRPVDAHGVEHLCCE